MGASARRLEDEESARALIDAQDVVVIGFFQVGELMRRGTRSSAPSAACLTGSAP